MKKFFALFAVVALCVSVLAEADWTNFAEFKTAFEQEGATVPVFYKVTTKTPKGYVHYGNNSEFGIPGVPSCQLTTWKENGAFCVILCQPCLVCSYDCEDYAEAVSGVAYRIVDKKPADGVIRIEKVDFSEYDSLSFFNYSQLTKSNKNTSFAYTAEDGETGFAIGTKDSKSWKFGKAGSLTTAIVKTFDGIFFGSREFVTTIEEVGEDGDPEYNDVTLGNEYYTGTFKYTRSDADTKKLMAAMFEIGECDSETYTCEELLDMEDEVIVNLLLSKLQLKKYDYSFEEAE